MTLSWEEFARFAVEFAKHSQTLGEDWQWVVREPGLTTVQCEYVLTFPPDRMGMSYLAKENVRRDVLRTTSPHSEEIEISSLELRLSAEEIQEEQNTILQHQLDSNVVHIYDYHVVYSTSYAAPVLYFRGYQEGRQESSFYQSSNLHQTGNRLDGTRFGTIFRMLIVTRSNDGTSLHNKYEVFLLYTPNVCSTCRNILCWAFLAFSFIHARLQN